MAGSVWSSSLMSFTVSAVAVAFNGVGLVDAWPGEAFVPGGVDCCGEE